jgi:hypothetical protein
MHPLYTVPYEMVQRYLFYWNQSLVRKDKLPLCNTGLGCLAVNPCNVGHHLVKIKVVVLVALNETADYRAAHVVRHRGCEVDQKPRLLRGVVKRPPHLPFLRNEKSTYQPLDFRIPSWNLLKPGV